MPGRSLDLGRNPPGAAAVRTGERFGPIRISFPPSGHQPTSRSRQTASSVGPPPIADSIRSRCAGLSTIGTGALAPLAGRQLDQLRERGSVGRGVGDDDVLESLADEVQGLGQGEGEDAPESRVEVEDAAQDRNRAH